MSVNKSDAELAKELGMGIDASDAAVQEIPGAVEETVEKEAPKKAAPKKRTTRKKAAAPVAAEPEVEEAPPVVAERAVDPEFDKENWPTIHIDSEAGKPNYEFLGAHGTSPGGRVFDHEIQVMRGVDVQVPPSIIRVLQDSVSTHYVPSRDPGTGKTSLREQNRSAVPWRLIKGGKYI